MRTQGTRVPADVTVASPAERTREVPETEASDDEYQEDRQSENIGKSRR